MHKSCINGHKVCDYIISAPIRSGLADIILGYMSGFIISLLSNRAFLILRGGFMLENDGHGVTRRAIDYAYHSPHINWTSPDMDESIYECLLPPYDHRQLPCNPENKTVIYGKTFKIHHIRGINAPLMNYHLDANDWSNQPDTIPLVTNNRGITLNLLNNVHHNHILKHEFGLTPDTMFPCIFHYLFRMNKDVCKDECKNTEATLIKNRYKSGGNTITIGIHARLGGGPGYFHCANDLIADYKTRGISVILLYVTHKEADQEYYKKQYGDMLLLPQGIPEKPQLVHERGFTGTEANDSKALRDSARDFYLMSLTDIQILSARSGFSTVAAMIKLTKKHRIYRIDGDVRKNRNCSAYPDGDPLLA
eukprot:gene2103-4108_t